MANRTFKVYGQAYAEAGDVTAVLSVGGVEVFNGTVSDSTTNRNGNPPDTSNLLFTYTLDEALQEWKIQPEVIDSSNEFTLRTLFNKKHTNCFGLSELLLSGSHTIKGNASFYVAVIYSGSGTMTCNDSEYDYSQGDEIFISAAISEITFNSKIASKILLCYPPN